MLQLPKAGVQTPGQVPLEMGCIYFSLKNHTSLVQASHIPDNRIEVHSKKRFIFSSLVTQTNPKMSLLIKHRHPIAPLSLDKFSY